MLVPRAVLQFAATFAVTLSIVNVSHAGPVERMADIALHPSNPDVMVIRYLNGGTGLLYTSDGGRNFQLLCSTAIDRGKPSGPTAIGSDGRVLVGTFEGMWRDDGKGCGWSRVAPLTGRWITDIVADPTNPEQILTASGNGGEGVTNSLIRGTADEWTDIGSKDELGITRIRAIKMASGMRLYESVLRIEPAAMDGGIPETKYLVRVSDDEGQSWREHAVTVESPSGSFRLEAIDPTNPDRLLGSIVSEQESDKLVVSADQGATWKPYVELSDLGGVAFAPDGRLWIGEPSALSSSGASRGLWFAPNLDAMPTKVYEADGIECLAYQPATETLVACRSFSFGTFELDEASNQWNFTESFHFRTAKDFVRCDGMDMAAMCEAQLCADYCAAGHFAQAQLCCAYATESCGPLVAEFEGTGGPEMCGGAGGGAAGSSAAGSMASPGMSGGVGGAAGGVPSAAGTSAPGTTGTGASGANAAPPAAADDGCSSIGPGQSGTGGALALLGLIGIAAILRRRLAAR